jgi:hypothetical protein
MGFGVSTFGETYFMRTLLVVGLVASAFGIGACSSSSPSTPPNHDTATFCENLAKAQCQVANTCASDPTACVTTLTEECNTNAATMEGDGRVYQQPAAQACIDAWSDAVGGSNILVKYAALEGNGSISDKCNRVFTGNLAKDSMCTSQYECSGSLSCFEDGTSGMAFCETETDVAAAGLCGNPGDVCATDTYCTGTPAKCTAAAATGAACDTNTPCVSADHCVAGACAPRSAAGGPCGTDDDSGSGAPYCDPYLGNKCAIGLEFAQEGPDCMGFLAGTSYVASGTSTTGDQDSGTGTDGAAAGD